VAVRRQRALVIEVVEDPEGIGQGVGVRRDRGAELGQGGVAVALPDVAEFLVVGPVLPDDQEDVLDLGRAAEPGRDGVVFGVNDTLRSGFDPGQIAAAAAQVVGTLRAAGRRC